MVQILLRLYRGLREVLELYGFRGRRRRVGKGVRYNGAEMPAEMVAEVWAAAQAGHFEEGVDASELGCVASKQTPEQFDLQAHVLEGTNGFWVKGWLLVPRELVKEAEPVAKMRFTPTVQTLMIPRRAHRAPNADAFDFILEPLMPQGGPGEPPAHP